MGALAAHRKFTALALSLAGAGALAGCGSQVVKGDPQDQAEPRGNFPVRVISASFPKQQNLAKSSSMQIVVENVGTKPMPNVNVTVKCGSSLGGSFDTATSDTNIGNADPRRPQFIVDRIPTASARTVPPLDPAPLERSSSLVDTYPLGLLAPGREATFRWDVTAVRAGPYHLCWRVNAGLYGKAKAVASSDSAMPLAGEFSGAISNRAPKATIAGDGRGVVTSGR